MKSLFLFGLLAVSLNVSCYKTSDLSILPTLVPKEGKGPIKEKVFNLNFDEISVSNSLNVEIIKAENEEVKVIAPDDILNDVVVEKTGEKLVVKMKSGINIATDKIKVKIFAKDFSGLEASSSASVVIRDKFTQDKTSVKVNSSAVVKGNLEANDLSFDVSSSGSFAGSVWAVRLDVSASSSSTVSISGKSKEAVMEVSSSASVSADEVTVKIADVQASSSGSLTLGVSDQLSAVASSSGSIAIKKTGNLAVVSEKENSGGSISIR